MSNILGIELDSNGYIPLPDHLPMPHRGRPRKDETEANRSGVKVWLTAQEDCRLRMLADEMGVSKSSVLRQCFLCSPIFRRGE